MDSGQNSHMPIAPDLWRSQVYSAEDQFTSLLNRGGPVDFFGSTLDLDPQRRFGDLDSVRLYVERACELVSGIYPGITPPQVRARKGTTRAHYEFTSQLIALPVADQWALRETVILHECAHHVTSVVHGRQAAPHGPEFAQTMLHLVRCVMGESAELLLRVGYQEAGVPIRVVEESL